MYTAIVNISAHVHKINDKTKASESCLSRKELQQFGIENKLVQVHGETKEECVQKAQALMEKIYEGIN